jgi:hypothetical protein
LHNVVVRSGGYGVWQLWEELQPHFTTFTFRSGNGLGVVWKAAEGSENLYLNELFRSSPENQERIRRYYSLCGERLEWEQSARAAGASSQNTVSNTEREEELNRRYAEAVQALERQHERVQQDLGVRLSQAEEQIERQRKAHLASVGERERIQAAHGLLTQELAIAKGNVEELKSEVERLTGAQGQSHSELLEAKKMSARLTAALEQERLLRAKIENSRFWQATGPLRRLVDLVRRGTRG